MKIIKRIDFLAGSREEKLPDFMPDFPYIASRAELEEYDGGVVPWHWHKTIELFYIERGSLEYRTQYGNYIFPEGSGGMVNSNVLHMTKPRDKKTVQLLHIFDTSLIAGETGSRIDKKYIVPITTKLELDMICLYPNNSIEKMILELIKKAFLLSEKEVGYEIKLREFLAKIWLLIFKSSNISGKNTTKDTKANERIKLMMLYIHKNFSEKISVFDIAKAGYMSERNCFRAFRECLHMTPIEYVKNYRLQKACNILIYSNSTISVISQECGLGSSSYFGKIFRRYIGMTPIEYRQRWQDSNI